MTEDTDKKTWHQSFVEYTIRRCSQDKGLAARLRRADNPTTEYQSWEHLGVFGINLEIQHQRIPFAIIAANIAKTKSEHNGNMTLGSGIANCYKDGNQSKQAQARLRRLLACNDILELSGILRPLLSLIASKSNGSLDYIRLLQQLQSFRFDEQRTRTKAQWAQEFYVTKPTLEAEVIA